MVQLDSGGGGDSGGTDSTTETDTSTDDTDDFSLDVPGTTAEVDDGSGDSGATSDPVSGGGDGQSLDVESGEPTGGDEPASTEPEPSPEDDDLSVPGTSAELEGGSPEGDTTGVTRQDDTPEPITLDAEAGTVEAQAEQFFEEKTGLDLEAGQDFVIEGTGSERTARLTATGQERLADLRARERRRARTARGQRLSPGESAVGFDVFYRGVPILGSQEEARAQADASSIDVEAVERVGEARAAAREGVADLEARIESDLEGQIGAARASALGITNPRLRQAVVESTDLERGRDFGIDVVRTGDGVQVQAELTDEFRRSFAEETLELRLERATGVDLDPGVDFQVVLGEDGSATPVFTDVGRGRVALGDLDRTVQDIERRTGLDLVGGEGPAAPPARSTDRLSSDVSALAEAEAFIGSVAGDAREALREGEGTLRSPYTGERFLGQDVLEPFVAGGLRGGVDLAQAGASIPVRAADLTVAGFEAIGEDIRAGGFGSPEATASEEFAGQAANVAGRLPFVAASTFIGQARESPLRTAGALAGSLGISAAAMRLLPASRFVIQPGEEAAGLAGNRLTRGLAGERTAERLFPDNEPLIFSEEFAIRQARNLRDRLAGDVEAETGPRATDPALPGDRPNLLSAEAVDEAMGVTGPSPFALARGRARRGATRARESFADLLDRFELRTRGVGSGPFGTVELKLETESEGDLVRDFDPSRSRVLGGGASERARQEMVERQKEVRRMMGGGFEDVRDPVGEAEARREAAERPEVGLEGDELPRASLRAELALAPDLRLPTTALGVMSAARSRLDQRARFRQDLDVAAGSGLEFESLLDLALESEFETGLETELDSELETETGLETELRSELAVEAEAEAETRADLEVGPLEVEADRDDEDDLEGRRRDPLAVPGLGIGATTEGDLLPGFVSETVADIALTSRRSGRAPPEAVLEEVVESGEAPLGELPTYEEVLGTEAEREAIEETRELFGLDAGGFRL